MRPLANLLLRALALSSLLLSAAPLAAQTVNNDDSCDISVAPAATLLLPWFRVDFNAPAATAHTTLFTVTNTSAYPQIARVTLWTDFAYPAFSFDIFLTGFDTQSINLRDVFANGTMAPPNGTPPGAAPGPFSEPVNPNHLATMVQECAERPDTIPPALLADLRAVFTTGKPATGAIGCRLANGSFGAIGGVHTAAIGYATIDLVATCSSLTAGDPAYFATELLFDNVLIGDYEEIDPDRSTGNYAGGNPLVHIRAIPEGGRAGSIVPTNLPFTFYDRLTDISRAFPRTIDRRQPLPTLFAARFIQGGQNAFNTELHIWREAYSGTNATCAAYATNAQMKQMAEVVRFDEHENATINGGGIIICTPPPPPPGPLPTSSLPTTAYAFPPLSASGDVAGWLYINASNYGSPAYTTAVGRDFKNNSAVFSNCARANQNWVAISMAAEGRFNVLFDAAQLANGCSLAPVPESGQPPFKIGPGANQTP